MSTKTTFKRVALVTVAALGFGVLTSVAPANAVNATPTSIAVGTLPTAQVGVAHKAPMTITVPLVTTGGSDSFTVNVRVTSAPTGSAFNSLASAVFAASNGVTPATKFSQSGGVLASGSTIPALIEVTTATTGALVNSDVAIGSSAGVGYVYTSAPGLATRTTASVSVNVTPDKAGTYVVLVSTNAGSSPAAYVAGDANASYTFTTGASVTAVALSAVTGSSTVSAAFGQVVKVTLTGALGLNETIAVSTSSSTAGLRLVSSRTTPTVDSAAATISMTSAHFVSGVGYFTVRNTAAETIVVTASGSGLLASSITSTLSVESLTGVTPTLVTMSDTAANVTAGGQAGHVGYTAATDKASTAATSHSYLATVTAGTAGDYLTVTVVDTAGTITGVAGLTYQTALATATTTTATVTVAAACTTAGACFTATVSGSTNGVVAVTAEAPAQLTVAVTGTTPTVMKAAHGASSVLQVVLKDQFRATVANSSASIATTGRNASTAATILNTDANGIVAYTRADAGTSTSANKQDVVTFTGGTAGTATVTINYTDSTLGITTVTLATPTTDDTVASGISYTDINASSSSGATGSTTARTWTSITATVTDVNGAVIAGAPVTFSTTSAGAAVASTFATVYTGADGTAVSKVYGWTAGVKTFTATAGAKSVTGTVAFRQGGATGTDSPTEVRNITAVASGNSIIVTAKDRFGNIVSGVPLFATRTGNGTFGGGSNTNGQTTGADGTAEFIFNAGSAASVVTITAGSTTAVAAACYGQTGNLAGIAVCSTAATQTAYTAATVGTTTTAEIGIGSTLSPAGNQTATVNFAAAAVDTTAADNAQAATDAAAEATDAANAATDAANAAAEAADAATAAAQDAADAVAALSAQVATLISGLKAQLTALTNLVIKIQKKVKA